MVAPSENLTGHLAWALRDVKADLAETRQCAANVDKNLSCISRLRRGNQTVLHERCGMGAPKCTTTQKPSDLAMGLGTG